jgi:hypothetical protein
MLPEQMWVEWLKDEIMCEGTGQSDQDILALFKLSLGDYSYLKVCKHYIRYIVKRFESQLASVEQVRQVFEQVLRVYALWVSSDKFWQPYLDLELLIGDKHQIRSIFRRWSVLPTPTMTQAFLKYQNWETDKSEFLKTKQKNENSLGLLQKFTDFENKFCECLALM